MDNKRLGATYAWLWHSTLLTLYIVGGGTGWGEGWVCMHAHTCVWVMSYGYCYLDVIKWLCMPARGREFLHAINLWLYVWQPSRPLAIKDYQMLYHKSYTSHLPMYYYTLYFRWHSYTNVGRRLMYLNILYIHHSYIDSPTLCAACAIVLSAIHGKAWWWCAVHEIATDNILTILSQRQWKELQQWMYGLLYWFIDRIQPLQL